jgi:GAF domain-containing protein
MLTEMDFATNLDKDMAKAALSELRQSTGCERCTLFPLDRGKGELFSLVPEGLEGQDIHLSLNLGIACLVAITGQELNIADVYSEPRAALSPEGFDCLRP